MAYRSRALPRDHGLLRVPVRTPATGPAHADHELRVHPAAPHLYRQPPYTGVLAYARRFSTVYHRSNGRLLFDAVRNNQLAEQNNGPAEEVLIARFERESHVSARWISLLPGHSHHVRLVDEHVGAFWSLSRRFPVFRSAQQCDVVFGKDVLVNSRCK